MTHILAKWRPKLDTSAFIQDGITNSVWGRFIEFVECCHASLYWKREAHDSKRHARSRTLGLKPRELKDYEKSAREQEERHFEAKWRAAELTFEMATLAISDADKSLVNELFKRTQLSPSNTATGHESAKFELFAIHSFPTQPT
ncbi:MAG: hypothetical protein H5U19_03625 [Rhodobacteraceae bacterium]|nr:hypothetical protein [Paracoccaceae bacterium]